VLGTNVLKTLLRQGHRGFLHCVAAVYVVLSHFVNFTEIQYPIDFRQDDQCREPDKHFVLHAFMTMHAQTSKIKAAFQTKEPFLDNILIAVAAYCFICVGDIIADNDKPSGCTKFILNDIVADVDGKPGP